MEPDPARKQAALSGLTAMGEEVLPTLTRALDGRDSPVAQWIFWMELKAPVAGGWIRPAADRQAAALLALEALGPKRNSPAIPALIRFLESPPPISGSDVSSRQQAIGLLGGMGNVAIAAVPALLEIVRADVGRGTPSARAALAAVNRIGGERADVGPVLVECLRSRDEGMRRLAAAGLADWGADATFAVEPLREALTQPDSAAFAEVAKALGQLGEVARSAAPELIRGLRDERSMVRAVAALSLGRVRPDPELVVEPLIQLLKDDDAFVRSQAARALGRYGAGAATATDELAWALSDESEAVQIAVIESLEAIGPGAIGAVPALERAQGNRQAGLGRYVAAALAKIGGEESRAGGLLE
jgi:HEAT repeat protein